MTKKDKLIVSQVLDAGLKVIKTPELAANRPHLERYLRNSLQIYKAGIDTLDMKIQFYQDLHDARSKTLKIPESELPGSPDLRKKLKLKISELEEKKREFIKAAKSLPDKLPLLNNDDQDFQKILQADNAWHAKNGCLILGMCICEFARHRPYKSSCLDPGKDFSVLSD